MLSILLVLVYLTLLGMKAQIVKKGLRKKMVLKGAFLWKTYFGQNYIVWLKYVAKYAGRMRYCRHMRRYTCFTEVKPEILNFCLHTVYSTHGILCLKRDRPSYILYKTRLAPK